MHQDRCYTRAAKSWTMTTLHAVFSNTRSLNVDFVRLCVVLRIKDSGDYFIITLLSLSHRQKIPIALFYSLSAKVDLRPVARQLRPEKYIRLDSPVGTWIKHSRPPQLILGKVEITIRSHRKRIRP